MNMANTAYGDQEFEYQYDAKRTGDRSKSSDVPKKRMSYSRASRPAVHNGIHRRRNKRFTW